MKELGWLPFGLTTDQLDKPLAVVIALLFVAINFKGVSETGLAGNIVTVAKVGIIGVFIVDRALGHVPRARLAGTTSPRSPRTGWAACSPPWG